MTTVYDLNKIATDSWVYQKIVRGMYGILIAGKTANNLLKKQITKADYHPYQFTAGLLKHVWRPVTFTLLVNDFGVKFVGKHHVQHLQRTLKKHNDINVDWTGEKYVNISLKWDYEKRTLDTSVPSFFKNKLYRFQHPTPVRLQHAPAKAAPINYGLKVQKPTP